MNRFTVFEPVHEHAARPNGCLGWFMHVYGHVSKLTPVHTPSFNIVSVLVRCRTRNQMRGSLEQSNPFSGIWIRQIWVTRSGPTRSSGMITPKIISHGTAMVKNGRCILSGFHPQSSFAQETETNLLRVILILRMFTLVADHDHDAYTCIITTSRIDDSRT